MRPGARIHVAASEPDRTESPSNGGSTHYLKRFLRAVKPFQFSIILALSTAVLLFQVGKCVQKYMRKSTGTADKYVHVSKTNFPILNVCPTYPYKLEQLQSHGVATKGDIQFGSHWVSNQSNVGPVDFYNDVVYQKEEIIKEVQIYAEGAYRGKNIYVLKANETLCGESIFRVNPYYYNGDCFAFYLPSCLRTLGVLEVVIDFFNKTDMFIHHEGQFLNPNSRSRVDVQRGQFVKIAINHEVVQLIGEDGSCAHYDNKEALIGATHYATYDDCMYSTMRDIMMAELSCTVPWLPDKSTICTEPEKRSAAFKLYQENRRNQKNVCPNSCRFTNMYFGPPVTGTANSEDSSFARAVFYFRRDVKITTEYYLYEVLSMMAEIGGYVGLLLGVSLFKLADINNFMLDWVITRKFAKEKTSSQQRWLSSQEKPHAPSRAIFHM